MKEVGYKGWVIITYKHIHYPPFLDFHSSAYKLVNNKKIGFTVEGETLEIAINNAKSKIDNWKD